MMKVLVTGGSGFVGRHVVRRLLDKHSVVVLDHKRPECMPEVSWVEGSILDQATVSAAVEEADAVVHLAAALGVAACQRNEAHVAEVNVEGTRRLCEAIRQSDSVRSLVFSSSSEVYGDAEPGQFFRENDTPRPLSVYGKSKVAGEEMLRALCQQQELRGFGFRLFNVYGPGQREDFVVPRFCRAAMCGDALVVHGSGRQTRTFTFVDEVAQAMAGAVDSTVVPKGAFELFNLCSEETVTINTLAHLVVAATGGRSRVVHKPFDSKGVDRASRFEIHRRVAANLKAREHLGFEPSTSLYQGILSSLESLKYQQILVA